MSNYTFTEIAPSGGLQAITTIRAQTDSAAVAQAQAIGKPGRLWRFGELVAMIPAPDRRERAEDQERQP